MVALAKEIQHKERLRSRSIPDPLEGVIPGENRQERFANFHQRTLERIWPAPLGLKGNGEYTDDLHRTLRFNQGDLDAYTQFSPQGIDPVTLSADQFNVVVNNLGTPDYVRVRSIDPILLNPDTKVVAVGGSCALETWVMRSTNELEAAMESMVVEDPGNTSFKRGDVKKDQKLAEENRKQIGSGHKPATAREIPIDPQVLPNFALAALDMSPTASHISGAMLGGQDVAVHYIESDMWKERLQGYGISEEQALQSVLSAYVRIHEAVQRRSLLINPRAQVLDINFNELDLRPAIAEWCAEAGIPYDPNLRIQEVMYTYVGPQIKQLLTTAVQGRLQAGVYSEEEQDAAESVLEATHHMRGKQLDHGRWGSMDLPKDVIVGLRELSDTDVNDDKDQNDTKTKVTAIRLMQTVFRHHTQGNPQAIYTGFADLPAPGNAVQHQNRDMGVKFQGAPGDEQYMESLAAQLTRPERLNNTNVEAHLLYLRKYVQDGQEARRELIERKTALVRELLPVQSDEKKAAAEIKTLDERVSRLEKDLQMQSDVMLLVNLIRDSQTSVDSSTLKNTLRAVIAQKNSALTGLREKKNKGSTLTDLDERDLQGIPELLTVLSDLLQGQRPEHIPPVVVELLGDMETAAKDGLQKIPVELTQKRKVRDEAVTKHTQLSQQLEHLLPAQEEIAQIEEQIKNIGVHNVFPLSDNPFVHHSMQFLWDPDFAAFLRDAVYIQEGLAQQRSTVAAKIAELPALPNRPEGLSSDEKKQLQLLEQERSQLIKQIKAEEVPMREQASKELRELMGKIYPKLESYILYLYGKIDYPVEMRSSKVLA